jgi:hypothetical protein
MDLKPYIFLSYPTTYRPIANFVGEIKKSLRSVSSNFLHPLIASLWSFRGIVESRDDLSTANHYFRVTIHGINHCFQVSRSN